MNFFVCKTDDALKFHIANCSNENRVTTSHEAFKKWRLVPAPKRGEIVRQIALQLRKYKDALSTLVSSTTARPCH